MTIRAPLFTRYTPRDPSATVYPWSMPGGQKLLVGKDKFFGAAGQGPPPSYDLPPRAPVGSADLRTWINPGGQPLLVSKDKFFGAAGMGPPPWYQPPPSGPRQPVSSLTHIQSGQPFLIGKDTIYGASGQSVPNYDWPVPKGPTPGSISLKTHIDVSRVWLIGQDQFFGAGGANQFNWPVPKAPVPATDLRTWIQGFNLTFDRMPVVTKFDWQLPQVATPAISLRTWTDPSKIWLIGKDSFFGYGGPDYDYPNPQIPVGSVDLRTWLQGYSLNLFAVAVVQSPFYQTDWPVPRGYTAAIDLRTWLQSPNVSRGPLPQGFNPDLSVPRAAPSHLRCNWTDSSKTWLIGQDQFFGLAGSPQFDWPVPKAPTPAIDLRTWLQGFSLEFDRPPVVTSFDLGNPRGATPALSLKTHINVSPIWLIGKDAQRFNQYDWLLPRAPRQPDQQSVWAAPKTLGLTVQAPFVQYDWPLPQAARLAVQQSVWQPSPALSIVIQVPFAQYDWPLPTSLLYPVDLRTLLQGWNLPLQTPPVVIVPRDIDAVLTKEQLYALRRRLADEKKRRKRDLQREQQSRQELRSLLESFFRDAPAEAADEISEPLPRLEAKPVSHDQPRLATLPPVEIDWTKFYQNRALMQRTLDDLAEMLAAYERRRAFEADEDDALMLMLS